jgi:hypothetical protein
MTQILAAREEGMGIARGIDVSTTPSMKKVEVHDTSGWSTNISVSLMLESGTTKIYRDESAEI